MKYKVIAIVYKKGFFLLKSLLFTPFLLVLSNVFIIDNSLAHGVVSGKYFWFYGSMGLLAITTLIYSLTNRQTFRFSVTDIFVFLFTGSIFLSAWLFGDISASSTKLTLLALLLVLYVCIRIAFEYSDDSRGLRVKPAMTIIISVLLLTAFCLYKQYPVYGAYKQWNKNRMYYQTGMYKEATENYEPLYPYLKDQIQFLFEYGRSLSQAGINEGIAGQARNDRLAKSNEVLRQAKKISCDPMLYNIMGRNYQAMREYDLAEHSLLKSTQIVPNRLYPWYLLMELYVETGDEEKAREMAKIVLTKEPKVQSTAVREMREEANKIRVKN